MAAIGAAAAMVTVVAVIVSLGPSETRPLPARETTSASSVLAEPDPTEPSPIEPSPTEPSPNEPSPTEPIPTEAGALPKAKPLSLEVPSIGVRTGALMDLGVNADNSLQVPPDAQSAGWFTEAPTPGEVGPAVIAGHVDYNRVPGVFTRLHDLKSGQEAIVRRADGTAAVFTIYRVDFYPKSDFPTGKVYGDTAGPELRLITCGGAFDHAARQYTDNVVAYGKLTGAFRT